MQIPEEILSGGNMNLPIRKNQLIYKEATPASQTIHELLTYVRARGVAWVPESKGINQEGKHVLTYLEGEVPHDTPECTWSEQFGMQTQKEELTRHARMYRHHATWFSEIMTNRLLA